MKNLGICLVTVVVAGLVGCGGGGGTAGPDLQVESVTLPFGTTTIEVGEFLSVMTVATNAGDEDAAASDMFVYLSSDAALDAGDEQIGSRSVAALAAGTSEASSPPSSLLVPDSLSAGTYYIIAEVDKGGAVAETDETNNVAVCAGTIAVTKTPDLTVDSVSCAVTTVATSTNLAINRRLRNLGKGDAVSFNVQYWLSLDTNIDGADTLGGTEVVASLAAETDDDGQYFINSGAVEDTFYVLVRIDGTDVVLESNELNNDAQSSNQLTVVASGQADLEPEIVSAPANLYVGDSVSVDIAANNIGSLQVPAVVWTCELYLSDDAIPGAGDDTLGTVNTNARPIPGGSFTHTFNFTVPDHTSAGYLILVVDTGDDVGESNEANNQAGQVVVVSTPPDLGPYHAPVMNTGVPHAARVGDTLPTIWGHVEEFNSVAVGPFRISGYLSEDSSIEPADTEICYVDLGSWPGGAAGSAAMNGSIPAGTGPGRYNVGCIFDSLDEVFETNEGNNVNAPADLMIFDVIPPALTSGEYDLAVENIWFNDLASAEYSPGEWYTSLLAGTTCKVDIDLKSLGDDPATSIRVGVYLSSDTEVTTGDTLVGYVDVTHAQITSLLESDFSVNCTIPSTLTTGELYYLGAAIDTLGAVTETDEDNNMTPYSHTVLVVDASDAIVDLIADGSDGPQITAMEVGEAMSFGFSVRTRSNTESGAFSVSFYLSVDSDLSTAGDNTLVGTYDFAAPGLAPGDQGPEMDPYWASITAPAAGDYYLGYLIDEADAVPEDDETNNWWLAGSQLTVSASGGPDLVVVAYMGDDGPGAAPTFYAQTGDTIVHPMLIVANFGTQDLPGGVAVNFYVSTDGATLPPVPAGDTLVGTYICGALEPGKYYPVEDPAALDLSGLTAGDYYLYAVIDPGNIISETDDNNNDSASLDLGGGALGFIPLTIADDAPFKADLAIIDVWTNDTYWLNGPNTYIWTDCELSNQSLSAASGPSVVSFWVSTNNTASIGVNDEYIGCDALGFLEPGRMTGAAFNGQLPFTPVASTNYYVKIVVDSLGEISEMDESNNLMVSDAFQFVP
ncbi:MAG: hypothetical protein JW909_03675 [Planctomycetes bacterium]|nr:hypothetical protein [Planctomycetota bacterium]